MNQSELNDNRWHKLKNIFNEVVELAPEARFSYLSALRLNDKTLYHEIYAVGQMEIPRAICQVEPVAPSRVIWDLGFKIKRNTLQYPN